MRFPFFIIPILIFSSCMLSKQVTVTMLKPAELKVSDSIKTVLIIKDSLYPNFFHTERKMVINNVKKIAYESIAETFSRHYQVKTVTCANGSADHQHARNLCKEYNADLLVDLRKINLISKNHNEVVTRTYYNGFFDGNDLKVTCPGCLLDYSYNECYHCAVVDDENSQNPLIRCSLSCPFCGASIPMTFEESKIEHIQYPFIIFKTRWNIYDYRQKRMFITKNTDRLDIKEYTINEVYHVSRQLGDIASRLIHPYLEKEKQYILYTASENKFVESIDAVSQGQWEDAAVVWVSLTDHKSRQVRYAACHNLAIFYQRKGRFKEALKYEQKEIENRLVFHSKDFNIIINGE